jgi:exodeoxyribonuclease VII small subunit
LYWGVIKRFELKFVSVILAYNREVEFAMSFSGDMERLQAIIGEFESEGLGMEDSLALFEEGVKLIRACREYLDGAKRRVTALIGDKEAGGDLIDGGE